LVDGLALTPDSFGMVDPNGTWIPKAYAGAYGTNGFHLEYRTQQTLVMIHPATQTIGLRAA